ncbi:MAG TPA: hydrogenase maturation nickel metallochaperone HypA [Saprospiraceae bacterium]|nr:hydrogenase maturation nickel metallochaperone HypA [Saprospiraceae bacterium]HMQ83705.1 hydrogenase maturation nickel metallochaperone HypA [Saprospiraceae bacterium]
MHELSIMHNIVGIAEEQVRQHQAQEVEILELEIGDLSGIEMEALLFAWEAAVGGTVLEKSKRIIHRIRGKAICGGCGEEYDMPQMYQPCPTCGGFCKAIIAGQELLVKSMTMS